MIISTLGGERNMCWMRGCVNMEWGRGGEGRGGTGQGGVSGGGRGRGGGGGRGFVRGEVHVGWNYCLH